MVVPAPNSVMDPAVAMTAPLTVKTPPSAARLAPFTVEGSVVVPAPNSVMDPAVAMTAPLTVKTPPSAARLAPSLSRVLWLFQPPIV